MVVATAKTLNQTMQALKNFMERREGSFKWAQDHNSKFKISKVAVLHCQPRARKPTNLPLPVLWLQGKAIKQVESYKYLGVHIDGQLCWRVQENKVMVKATSYVMMFCRLTCTNLGIRPRLMWLLYISVAVPKMMYALDV